MAAALDCSRATCRRVPWGKLDWLAADRSPGYFQPVAFVGPPGVHFSLPQGGGFADRSESLQAGLLVGGVYRFQITGIPGAEGAELYPTIEVIDRTYPPPGSGNAISDSNSS